MLKLEDAVSNSDFSLSGAALSDVAELLGQINNLAPNQRPAAIKALSKNINQSSRGKNSRDNAIERLQMIDGAVVVQINNKRYQLSDTNLYVVKDVSTSTAIKMFADTDAKATDLGNVSKGMLSKDNWFLVDKITVLAGSGASAGVVAFDTIPAVMKNGWFKFGMNGKNLMPVEQSNEVFDLDNTSKDKGTLELDNPKWIEPQQAIVFDMDWKAATAATFYAKVILRGTSVIPY